MNNKKNHNEHHIIPLKIYVITITALLALTALTVAVSYLNFGSTAMNAAVAMAIASAKASLVLLFFMGLKWDSNANRIAILSSILTLAVFVWLTASDLWARRQEKFITIKKVAPTLSLADVKKMEISSPQQITQGKALYNTNCTACHGTKGRGDGVAGAALKPQPRNFYAPSNTWTNGTSAKSIFVSISQGIPNTGMASFTVLSIQDRWALTHYIRSKAPNPQTTSKADGKYILQLSSEGIGKGSVKKTTVPIDLIIDTMVEENKK